MPAPDEAQPGNISKTQARWRRSAASSVLAQEHRLSGSDHAQLREKGPIALWKIEYSPESDRIVGDDSEQCDKEL